MRSGNGQGRRGGKFPSSSLTYALWGWSYVLFKIVCAVADLPADVKIETVGVEDGGVFSVSVNARNLLLTQ
jgi:hypothetical protein